MQMSSSALVLFTSWLFIITRFVYARTRESVRGHSPIVDILPTLSFLPSILTKFDTYSCLSFAKCQFSVAHISLPSETSWLFHCKIQKFLFCLRTLPPPPPPPTPHTPTCSALIKLWSAHPIICCGHLPDLQSNYQSHCIHLLVFQTAIIAIHPSSLTLVDPTWSCLQVCWNVQPWENFRTLTARVERG